MNKDEKILAVACKNYEEDLVLHYYGDGSETESRRVEEHLGGCGSCRRFLEDLRHFLPNMAKTKELPQTFWDGYYRELVGKLDAVEERRGWWKSLFPSWSAPVLGTAAAAAVLALGLLFTMPTLPWQPNKDQTSGEILSVEANVDFFKAMDLLESLQVLEAQEADEKGDHAGQQL